MRPLARAALAAASLLGVFVPAGPVARVAHAENEAARQLLTGGTALALEALKAALDAGDVHGALAQVMALIEGPDAIEDPPLEARLGFLSIASQLAWLARDAVQAEVQTDRLLGALATVPVPPAKALADAVQMRELIAIQIPRAEADGRLVRRVASPAAHPAGIAEVALALAKAGPLGAVEGLANAVFNRLDADDAAERKARRARGEARRRLGDLAGADQDLAAAAHEAPPPERVAARLDRARVALDRRDFAAAQRLVTAAANEARGLTDGGLEAEVLRVGAGLDRLRGDLPAARAAYDLAAARDPDPRGRARALISGADLSRRMGDTDGAISRGHGAHEAARELQTVDMLLLGQAMFVMGQTALAMLDALEPDADALHRRRRAEGDAPVPEAERTPREGDFGVDDAGQPLVDPEAAAAALAATATVASSCLENANEALERAYGSAHDPRLAPARAELADLRDRRGDLESADAALADALLLAEAAPLQAEAWEVYAVAGRIARRRGSPSLAVLYLKRAVDALQGLRRQVGALGDAADAPFQVGFREHYAALADALIEAGRLPEAQEALELLKRSEYRGFTRDAGLTRDATGRTPAELDLEARAKAASAPVLALSLRYGALLDRKRAASSVALALTAAENDELARLRAALTAERAQWLAARQSLLKEMADADDARAQAARVDGLADDGALQATLKRLGPGAVLVHTLITADRLHLLVTAPHARLVRTVTVPAATLHREIHALRQALMVPGGPVEGPAAALYARLVAPIRADLEAGGARTLHFALDGALRYVPMAALYDAAHQRYLVEDFAVVLHTAAARNQLDRPPAERLNAAGLGVRHGGEGFSPLPGAAAEVEAVVRRDADDPDGALPGIVRLDEAFTRAAFTEALESGFSVVHIASHFAFRPGTDADSFLLLGDGQRLTLADLRSGPYPFDAVDLLTLSACDTALGTGDGREVDGFGALAQAQGARAVLATLWPVADRSTSALMARLYGRLAQRNVGAPAPAKASVAGAAPVATETADRVALAEALAEVQRAFIRGEISARGGDDLATRKLTLLNATAPAATRGGPAGWKHPYHWAPFILMGDGR